MQITKRLILFFRVIFIIGHIFYMHEYNPKILYYNIHVTINYSRREELYTMLKL